MVDSGFDGKTGSTSPSTVADDPRSGIDNDVKSIFAMSLQKLLLTGSVVGATLFVLSSASNQFIFWFWGLSFLQIATPTDVLMSGLSLALKAMWPLLAAGAGFELTRRCGRRPMTTFIVLGLVGVLIVLFMRAGDPEIWLGVGSGLPVGAFWAVARVFLRSDRSNEVRIFFGLLGLYLALITLVSVASAWKTGFFNGLVTVNGMVDCEGRLFWRGERAQVLACKTGSKEPAKLRVVFDNGSEWDVTARRALPSKR